MGESVFEKHTPLKKRSESIDTMRGLGAIMVIVVHVIGLDSAGGMEVPDDSIWRYIYSITRNMPLITAISGWVYAIKPATAGSEGAFIWNKVKRILLPMAAVSTLYYLVRSITPSANIQMPLSDIWQIYVLPFSVYWYLPSIFLIFCLISLIERLRLLDTPGKWLALTLASCVLPPIGHYMASVTPNVLTIWSAISILPYFLIGLGLRRFAGLLTTPVMKKIYLAAFLCVVLILTLPWFFGKYNISLQLRETPFNVLIGIVYALFLLTCGWNNRVLAWVGVHSYAIYLFHAFGTSAGRIISSRMHIDSYLLMFVIGLSLGILVPVVVDRALSYIPALSTIFIGKRYKTKPKEKK